MQGKEPYALASVHVAKDIHDQNPAAFRERVALAVINEMEDLQISRAHQTLRIGAADIETAIQLKIPLNAPTAEAHCVVTDTNGIVIYSGDIIYPGDRGEAEYRAAEQRILDFTHCRTKPRRVILFLTVSRIIVMLLY